MDGTSIDANLVINELVTKVNDLTYEGVLKDVLIKQFKKEIELLQQQVTNLINDKQME